MAVVLWCQPDGLWRWRWVRVTVDGTEETSLPSHMAFVDESEARQAAGEAYPSVPILREHTAAERKAKRRGRVRRLLAVVLVAVLVIQAMRRGPAREGSGPTETSTWPL